MLRFLGAADCQSADYSGQTVPACSGVASQGREARGRSPHRFFIGREGCGCSLGGEKDIGEADTALARRLRLALSSGGIARKEVSDSDRVDGTLFPGQKDCTVSGGFSRLSL